jgi:type I restriction enzyme, S subunit
MAFTMTVAELINSDTSGMLAKHTNWERVPLVEVADILNGAPFDSTLFSTTQGVPLIRIRDVISGETTTFYTGPHEDAYLVRQGDLLVGMDGDFNSGFWGAKPALLNQRVCKISPKELFYDKKFLAFTLPGYLAAINANTPSVTVKHLSSKTIGDIGLPLPPRAEQARIVAKLEELLSDLNAGVAELKAAKKKLAQYRQSLLKAAVEGTLTFDWRAKNPATETGAQLLARILTERRARWEARQLAKFKEQGKPSPKDWQKKYPEPVQPDTTGLPELPQGWVWACLDALIVDGPQNGLYLPGDRYGFGTPILRIDDYQIGWHRSRASLNLVNADEALCKTYSLVSGDLVINRVNSMTHLGKSLLVTKSLDGVLFESNMMRSSLSALSSGEFVAFYLGSDVGRMRLTRDAKWAVNQASINQQDVRRTPVPVAPAAEQEVIASLLKEQLDAADRQRVAIEQSLKQSTAQRQNILRAAFSGQLVPQDPNDEPASVLLARIRAERTQREADKKPRGRKPKDAI